MILQQTTFFCVVEFCHVQAESLWPNLASLKLFYWLISTRKWSTSLHAARLSLLKIQPKWPTLSRMASPLLENEGGCSIIPAEWQHPHQIKDGEDKQTSSYLSLNLPIYKARRSFFDLICRQVMMKKKYRINSKHIILYKIIKWLLMSNVIIMIA